jgi:hypothetical protein
VPSTFSLYARRQDVDARDERGHDGDLASQHHPPNNLPRAQIIERR